MPGFDYSQNQALTRVKADRDGDGLLALLADDVKLIQSSHPLRAGAAGAGLFFTIYAKSDGVWLAQPGSRAGK